MDKLQFLVLILTVKTRLLEEERMIEVTHTSRIRMSRTASPGLATVIKNVQSFSSVHPA